MFSPIRLEQSINIKNESSIENGDCYGWSRKISYTR